MNKFLILHFNLIYIGFGKKKKIDFLNLPAKNF